MEDILLSVLRLILASFATWLIAQISRWFSAKIKDINENKLLRDALGVVVNAVKATYQTYVESLKNKDLFDKDAQRNALALAKEQVLKNLKEETKEYIRKNFGDIEQWVITTIESVIYDLKK